MTRQESVKSDAQAILEVLEGATSGPGKSQPPSGVTNECPIISIVAPKNPCSGEVEIPPAPRLNAHVVASSSRPGELSLRLTRRDESWRAFLIALELAGFKPGDLIRIEAIRQ